METFTVNLHNTVTCLSCGETITSLYRHDFQTCACGAISVDGGFDYQRRVAADGAQWEEWAGAWERDDREAARLAQTSWRSVAFRRGEARL